MRPIYENLLRSRDRSKDHRQTVKWVFGSKNEVREKKGRREGWPEDPSPVFNRQYDTTWVQPRKSQGNRLGMTTAAACRSRSQTWACLVWSRVVLTEGVGQDQGLGTH